LIITYEGITPKIHPDTLVQDSAVVIGDVELAARVSIWFHAVLRGDVNYIRIGEGTNIQDGCMVHVTLRKWPTVIGAEVTVGHRAVIHGATIGDLCLIGMGSIILDGVEIGDGSLVGAGAVVPPGMKIPARTLVMGVPAKIVRPMTAEEVERTRNQGLEYLKLMEDYRRSSA
jgi:carbonic anhydrase/acetyltransferase-like protein (isoleucine patch superfamily)